MKQLLFWMGFIFVAMGGVQKMVKSPDGKFQALITDYTIRLCSVADCDRINAEHTFQQKIVGVSWGKDKNGCVGVTVHLADGSNSSFLPADIMCSVEHARSPR